MAHITCSSYGQWFSVKASLGAAKQRTVSWMIVSPEIEQYAEAHTTCETAQIKDLAAETVAKLEDPGMMVGAVEGRLLEMLAFATKARSILEIGTFSGYSCLAMAAGMPSDGHITTCEISERHAGIARRNIARCGYADRIDVLLGPALDTLATLDGPFDLIFIDADKRNYIPYYEAAIDMLSPAGIIVVDNTLWSARVLDPGDTTEDTSAIRAFNDHVRDDPRVVCVLLTVRDGVTIIRKAV